MSRYHYRNRKDSRQVHDYHSDSEESVNGFSGSADEFSGNEEKVSTDENFRRQDRGSTGMLCSRCQQELSGKDGYRLGGKGAREDLAALARAARRPLRNIPRTVEKIDESESICKEIEKKAHAALLSLSPSDGRYAPWIDTTVFMQYLSKLLGEIQTLEVIWSYPRVTHRIMCVKVDDIDLLKNKLKIRSTQTIFHQGQRLRLQVSNHEQWGSKNYIPFKDLMKRLGIQAPSEAVEKTPSPATILSLSINELLDLLNDEIVTITDTFSSIAEGKLLKGSNQIYKCLTANIDDEICKTLFRKGMKTANLVENSINEYTCANLEDFIRLYLIIKSLKEGSNDSENFKSNYELEFTQEAKYLFRQYRKSDMDQRIPYSEIVEFFQNLGIRESKGRVSQIDSSNIQKNGIAWNDIKHIVEELQACRN